MKRKLKGTIIILLLLICTLICVYSDTYAVSESGYYTYSVSGGKTTIIKVNTSISGNVVIPAILGGSYVEEIGSGAFDNCHNVLSVKIPDCIKIIGEGAFDNCDNLLKISVDENNQSYSNDEYGVLFNKNKTTLIKFPAANTANEYTISDSVSYINETAFLDADNLEKILVHDDNQYFSSDSGMLYSKNKTVLVKYISRKDENSFKVPETVTTIGGSAFRESENLTDITLHSGIEVIGTYAFSDCDKIEEILIPHSVIKIDEGAFFSCDNLETIHYVGTESDWKKITTGDNNYILKPDIHYIQVVEKKNPTCTEEGYEEGLYCSDCAIWLDGHNKIPVLGHSWNKGKVRKSSTCKTKGVLEYTCNNDSKHKYTEALPLDSDNHEGEIVIYDETPASCTEEGYTAGKYCCGCKRWIEGHSIIPKKKHQYTSSTSKAATCTEDGLISFICECKDVYTSVIPAKGHKFSTEYTLDKAATCLSEGSKSRHCTVKGCSAKTDVSVIKKLAHNETTVPGKKATCTTSGLTEGKKCKACGKVTVTQKKVAKLGHSETVLPAKEASCTDTGLTKGKKCKTCGVVTLEQKVISKQAHSYVTVTQKATLSKNGSAVTRCISCNKVSEKKVIYRPKSIKLSSGSFTYSNKSFTPSVEVKDSERETLKKTKDYDVSYEKGRKMPGKYTVTITFKGKYEGEKKLYFTIKPKKITKITVTQTSNSITLSWDKVAGADGYRIYRYNKSSKKYDKIKNVTATTCKISKLKSDTVYKFIIRAFTKDNGTILGDKSSVFSLSTGPAKPTIKVSSPKTGTATVSWKRVRGADAYQLYYSTNKNEGFKRVNSYKNGALKTTKQKLKSGKVYYFKLRASKKTANGTVYSSWSDVKKVKVK